MLISTVKNVEGSWLLSYTFYITYHIYLYYCCQAADLRASIERKTSKKLLIGSGQLLPNSTIILKKLKALHLIWLVNLKGEWSI